MFGALPFSYKPATVSDPYWANVVSLLSMDGSSGSTTFTDLSSYNLSCSVLGQAKVSQSVVKFGTGSLETNAYSAGSVGDNRAVLIANNAVTNFAGLSYWTAEGWVYLTAYPTSQGYLWSRDGSQLPGQYGQFFTDILNDGRIDMGVGSGNSTSYLQQMQSPSAISLNTWHHIAQVVDNGVMKMFLNGVLQTSASISIGSMSTSSQGVLVGAARYTPDGSIGNYAAPAYIDEFRLTRGVARYTTNFTPPTTAFPRS